jgi:hypothetical protein
MAYFWNGGGLNLHEEEEAIALIFSIPSCKLAEQRFTNNRWQLNSSTRLGAALNDIFLSFFCFLPSAVQLLHAPFPALNMRAHSQPYFEKGKERGGVSTSHFIFHAFAEFAIILRPGTKSGKQFGEREQV